MNATKLLVNTLLVGLSFSVTETNAQGTAFINISCAKYVEETALSPSNHAYNWFVAGYVTSANITKNRQSPTDAATYRVWLTTYCQQRPFDNFLSALTALDDHLGEGIDKPIARRQKAL